MASIILLLLVCNLSTLGLGSINCPETTGFCSQVYEMQRVCSGMSSGGQILTPKIGKAGPAGRKGEPGETAPVDYAEIDEKITTKFRELEAQVAAKFRKYDQLIEKIDNRTKKTESMIHSECGDFTRDDALSWDRKGGVFTVRRNAKEYEVYCDLTTDGGKWLVFQRRIDGNLDFQQSWNEYVSGFGNNSKEFWMGLEEIHQLTQGGAYELRIDLTDWNGKSAYAKYHSFSVGDASTKYRLSVGSYSGNAGNALGYHNNQKFSTRDQDNDNHSSAHCAKSHGGGWWFHSCDNANLNGVYHVGGAYSGTENGVEWDIWNHGGQYSMKTTEMKMRPMT